MESVGLKSLPLTHTSEPDLERSLCSMREFVYPFSDIINLYREPKTDTVID
jgi:hypothetical protein